MKITGSRLARGNKLFPPSISIEESGLTVEVPGFLKGNSTFLAYTDISSMSVDSKMIGYSTIHFNAMGSRVSAHGFKKSEVEQIKAAIDNGKSNSGSVNTEFSSSGGQTIIHKETFGSSMAKGLFHQDPEQMKRADEEAARIRAAIGTGIVSLFKNPALKKAMNKHQELLKLTDEIDILSAQGKKDEALNLIRQLDHPSNKKMPDSEIKFFDFWANKRKEYIQKLTN
jgi:hypothetical protein